MSNEALPEGTDGAELHTSMDIKDVNIEYRGKIWKFQFVELSWKEKMELAAELQDQQTNVRSGITTTTPRYWKYLTQVYTKCVRKCPDGFRFDKCSPDFGELLIKAMPGVGSVASPDDLTSEETKN